MKKLAVFASGRGSNFITIFKNIQKGVIPARVSCLISDNSKAAVLNFAEVNGIPFFVIPPKNFPDEIRFGEELLKVLLSHKVSWIILAGYLKKIPPNVIQHYANRIVNIHPALLPAFGGKGMYGHFVHEAVLQSGTKVSGVTVHLVNDRYDCGPIVMQKPVSIDTCSRPEEIARKVLKVEHQLYSKALKKLLTVPFTITGNRVVFTSDHASGN